MARAREATSIKKISVVQALCLILAGILKLDMDVSKDLSNHRARYDYTISNRLESNSSQSDKS